MIPPAAYVLRRVLNAMCESTVATLTLCCATHPCQVHYGEVHGFDTTLPRSAGPLFRVPITYLSPVSGSEDSSAASSSLRHQFGELTFSPGQIHHRVVHVPEHATYFTIRFRPGGSWGGGDGGANNRIMVVHCQQLVPQRAHRDSMLEKYFRFNRDSGLVEFSDRCYGNRTMDITLAQFWNSSVGDSSALVDIEFAGVEPAVSSFDSAVTLEAKQGFVRVDVTAPRNAAKQTVQPTAKLTHLERAIHPVSYEILPVVESTTQTPVSRNAPTVDGTPVYALHLEYNFKVAVAGEHSIHAGAVSEVLYENPFGSQMRIVYDSNNRVVGAMDAWGGNNPTGKLEKGSYTVRLALRHTSLSLLESSKSLVLKVRSSLTKPVSLSCFTSIPNLLQSSGAGAKTQIVGGDTVPVFFKAPSVSAKALGADASSGTTLTGSCTWISGGKPDKFNLRVVVCNVAAQAPVEKTAAAQEKRAKARIAKAKEAAAGEQPPKHSLEALTAQIRDVKVKHLAAIATELAKQDKQTIVGNAQESAKAAEAAASAAGLWQAEYDAMYASSDRDEKLTLQLLKALLSKQQEVILALETVPATETKLAEALGTELKNCDNTVDAVLKEWAPADVALALARQKPDAGDVAAATAYDAAQQKQKQIFKAKVLRVRTLALAAARLPGQGEFLRDLNVAFDDLKTHPVVGDRMHKCAQRQSFLLTCSCRRRLPVIQTVTSKRLNFFCMLQTTVSALYSSSPCST